MEARLSHAAGEEDRWHFSLCCRGVLIARKPLSINSWTHFKKAL
jgi:hypothetical protein